MRSNKGAVGYLEVPQTSSLRLSSRIIVTIDSLESQMVFHMHSKFPSRRTFVQDARWKTRNIAVGIKIDVTPLKVSMHPIYSGGTGK